MSTRQSIMVKFGTAREQDVQRRELQRWIGDEAVDLQPLFPGDDDPELSTIFEVHLKNGCNAGHVIEILQKIDEIEYAHTPAERETK